MLSRRLLTVFLVTSILLTAAPGDLLAGDAVVEPGELHRALLEKEREREIAVEKVRAFLTAPAGREVLKGQSIDLQRVDRALSQLSDAELERLSSQVESLEDDFAAGDLSGTQVLLIVAIVALVLIIAIAA